MIKKILLSITLLFPAMQFASGNTEAEKSKEGNEPRFVIMTDDSGKLRLLNLITGKLEPTTSEAHAAAFFGARYESSCESLDANTPGSPLIPVKGSYDTPTLKHLLEGRPQPIEKKTTKESCK